MIIKCFMFFFLISCNCIFAFLPFKIFTKFQFIFTSIDSHDDHIYFLLPVKWFLILFLQQNKITIRLRGMWSKTIVREILSSSIFCIGIDGMTNVLWTEAEIHKNYSKSLDHISNYIVDCFSYYCKLMFI